MIRKTLLHAPGARVLLIVLFCLLSLPAQCQKQGQQLIDSLLQQLPQMRDDSSKVKVLNTVSYNFFFVDAHDGIKYGQQALTLAQKLKWKKGIATACKNIGNSHMNLSNYDAAIDHYLKALELFAEIQDKSGEARTLSNLASVYDDKGDHGRALTYALRALRAIEETGDKAGQSRIYTTIGTLYETPKKWEDALQYYSLALELSNQLKDKQSVAINEGNMGNVYKELKDYDKALEYDEKALAVYEELQDSSAMANKLSNIANVYEAMGNAEKALEYSFRTLDIYKRVGDKQATGILLGHIGSTYYKIGIDTTGRLYKSPLIPANKKECLKRAIQYLEQAKDIFESIQAINLLYPTFFELAEAYLLTGDVVNGPKYMSLYNDLRDSAFITTRTVKMANAEKEHEQQQKEKQKQINRLILQKKRNEQIYFAIGGVMLLIIIVLIARERRRSERLLMNILPAKIAARLKHKEHPIADHFAQASILFMDMADFTKFADNKDPKIVVTVLDELFTRFDQIAERHGLEKIKTIGDCYMAAAGVPEPRPDHAEAAASMALDVKAAMQGYKAPDGTPLNFRIGLHCGPVVAGVIGKKKYVYDMWGDAVNTASRMESSGLPGEIHCSDDFKNSLPAHYTFLDRGTIVVKSKGLMQTWLLVGKSH